MSVRSSKPASKPVGAAAFHAQLAQCVAAAHKWNLEDRACKAKEASPASTGMYRRDQSYPPGYPRDRIVTSPGDMYNPYAQPTYPLYRATQLIQPPPDPYSNPTRPIYTVQRAPPPPRPPGVVGPYYPLPLPRGYQIPSRPYNPDGGSDDDSNPPQNPPQNPPPPSIPPPPPRAAPVVSAGAEAAFGRIEEMFDDLEFPPAGTKKFNDFETDILSIIDSIIANEARKNNESTTTMTFMLYQEYGDIMIQAASKENLISVARGLQERKKDSGN